MNNVLVTGATGRSGKWFLKELKDNANSLIEYEFLFTVRGTSKTEVFDNLPVEYNTVQCDIENPQELEELFIKNRIDTVLHISGVSLSLRIVKKAVEHGVKRLILVHTTGIYSKYKAAGEEYRNIEKQIVSLISGKGVELTILRPTMIYGTLDDHNICQFIQMVDKLPLFPTVRGGRFALQPVHHCDLGKAYYQVLVSQQVTRNKNYVISGGTVINLIDILKTISSYLGKNNTFISIPFWFAYTLAVILYVCTFSKVDYREKVQRLVEPRAYSHAEATKDFGYSPIDFKDGLKDEVTQYILNKKREK